ncbi:hypothetical protein [Halomonas sp. BC2]|uniref:hypothetical protein n=1 Tax=unclassified Halomonas TaxID=2609666 RepID=UPI0009C03F8B|nr:MULTISPECIES: hypothetical protein [unclassified Halomonas]
MIIDGAEGPVLIGGSMFEKSYKILAKRRQGKLVVVAVKDLAEVDLIEWVTGKASAGIRPVEITNRCIVVDAKRVFMEPLGNGCSILSVFG